MPTVVDNTVLSNFALVDALDLLREALPPGAATTRFVLDEFRDGQDLGRLPAGGVTWLNVLELGEKDTSAFARFRARLGAGEASCLAIAV